MTEPTWPAGRHYFVDGALIPPPTPGTAWADLTNEQRAVIVFWEHRCQRYGRGLRFIEGAAELLKVYAEDPTRPIYGTLARVFENEAFAAIKLDEHYQ